MAQNIIDQRLAEAASALQALHEAVKTEFPKSRGLVISNRHLDLRTLETLLAIDGDGRVTVNPDWREAGRI